VVDPQSQDVGANAHYLAADPAVVEIDLLAQASAIEYLGQRAAYPGKAVEGHRSGRTIPGQLENIAPAQYELPLGLGKFADASRIVDTLDVQNGPGGQVGRLVSSHDETI